MNSIYRISKCLTLTSRTASQILRFNSSISSNKVYELRTYSIKPESLKEFLGLTNEKFHLRTRASVLHGYWTVELGGINQVVHLWEYDNFEHRASVRAQLSTDQEWIGEYFGKVVKMFQLQDNLTLNSLSQIEPGTDVFHPSGKGVYELWQFNYNEKITQNDLSNHLRDFKVLKKSAQLCGAFSSLFGPGNTAVLIWRHESFDNANNLRQEWQEFLKNSGLSGQFVNFFSKALVPVAISPMK